MAKKVEWDPVTLYPQTIWLRMCMSEYDEIAKVEYSLNEGMKGMERIDAFKDRVQILLDQYFHIADADISNIEQVVNEMVELDRTILERADTSEIMDYCAGILFSESDPKTC